MWENLSHRHWVLRLSDFTVYLFKMEQPHYQIFVNYPDGRVRVYDKQFNSIRSAKEYTIELAANILSGAE